MDGDNTVFLGVDEKRRVSGMHNSGYFIANIAVTMWKLCVFCYFPLVPFTLIPMRFLIIFFFNFLIF